jgi:hypothetical protein
MEIWKTYIEKYQVSNCGNVMNEKRNRLLIPCHSNNGYLIVNLRYESKHKTHYVHRMVAETFIPNPENHNQINHIDGDKTNNNVSNLEWCTGTHNRLHAFRIGLQISLKGEKSGRSKLTESQVKKIKELHGVLTQKEIAKTFNVTYATIGRIHRNEIWKHLS